MSRTQASLLGIVASVLPALVAAQARPSPPRSGPIGVTLPAPPMRMGNRGPGPVRHGIGGRPFSRRFGNGWSYPIVVESPYAVQVPVPYPVPYYGPLRVPSAALGTRPTTPPRPYDPEKARMTIIGSGADGGGGVLQIVSLAGDTIGVTWRGTSRTIRSAEIFLADSVQRPLLRRRVTSDDPVARFNRGELVRPAAFAGVIVVYDDGAAQTTLVPLSAARD